MSGDGGPFFACAVMRTRAVGGGGLLGRAGERPDVGNELLHLCRRNDASPVGHAGDGVLADDAA